MSSKLAPSLRKRPCKALHTAQGTTGSAFQATEGTRHHRLSIPGHRSSQLRTGWRVAVVPTCQLQPRGCGQTRLQGPASSAQDRWSEGYAGAAQSRTIHAPPFLLLLLDSSHLLVLCSSPRWPLALGSTPARPIHVVRVCGCRRLGRCLLLGLLPVAPDLLRLI